MKTKCTWCVDHPLEEIYHDAEWGVPVHDDRLLFEMLTLEGAQAGLSWTTILVKRENYRKAFDNFVAEKIVKYGPEKVEALLQDAGIVRNRLKINSTITNAKAFLEVQKEYGSFSEYIWSFVDAKPIQNAWATAGEVPAKTELSDRMSKALKKKGFKFIGSTICYAFMQAVGIVNDHTTDCFRYEEIKKK
ncbi:DNA-3-methyladenine glycosylase I [Neolewinella agarilytica]|uniref:DNA-3-methyladenine glycosylase I n=1 Tax=Neolewinella agarilytica TaxID=478744 RepID=UPI00235614B3|nr:DNA-3-methyladenine glycosylase I [Neolewinella agarilytica]